MRPTMEQVEQVEREESPRAQAWWAWHDANPGRTWTMSEALETCAAWVLGMSDDGPER